MNRIRSKLRAAARRRRAGEAGQAALAMVLGIVMLLVTGGTILASNTVQHDPLVQNDVVTHYSYRALEAGINGYLNTINAQPNLVNCSSATTRSTCTNAANGIKYDIWTQVPDTTPKTGNVPEWYLWTNPQFCFSSTKATATTCTPLPTSGQGNFEYVQILVIGAAGANGHYAYQSSVANFAPKNGFLTHIWWSNYEATDPALKTQPASACHYDWAGTKYGGPTTHVRTTTAVCKRVYFGPHTVVNGPVFANDSIYVTGGPNFGTPTVPSPVTTADPHCLFVDPNDGHGTPSTCAGATADVGRDTPTNSHANAGTETPPVSDTELEQVARLGGCVYSGPTTISFYATPTTKTSYMNVTSPETKVPSTGHDGTNTPTNNHSTCVGAPGQPWPRLPVPSGANGNGVIFVANSTWGNNGSGTCTGDGDNPFDAIRQGRATTTVAQIVAPGHFPGTTHGYNFTDDISKVGADCEGDVFVKDADTVNTPSGGVPGVAGNLTVAAANNVVVTGSLEYTDCGTKFATTNDHKSGCHYNTGTAAVNDSLGLIATNYVEVNRPGQPSCTTNYYGGGGYGGWGGGGGGWGGGGGGGGGTTTTCKASPVGLLGTCTKANVKDLTAVLCRPGSTVVIDAAILALSHSFAVDNYTVGGMTGQLGIFGAVAQDWRGAVGTIGSSGYTKDYNWDSRLQYVSIPYYLTPGTPSWALVSSSVRLTSHCPSWPAPYPSAGTTISPATTVDPSGNHGAC